MPDSSSAPQSTGISVLIVLLILGATLGAYVEVYDYPFISLDDHLYVMENPNVRSGLSLESLSWAFTESHRDANYWIPLTWVSFILDWELYGSHSGGYHLTNLLLHGLNSVLLFLWLEKSTRRRWRSAICAMIFALHPLHVESVAWVTERKDVLSTFFWMLGLWSYSRYTEKPVSSRYGLVVLCFCGGLMAKPMLVTFPFVLLLLDFWPLQRISVGTSNSGGMPFAEAFPRLLKEKIPLFAVSLAGLIAAWLTQQQGGAIVSLMSLPLEMRIRAVPVFYVEYLFKMIWPVDLALVYPYPPFTPVWKTIAAICVLLTVTYVAFQRRQSKPYVLVGWLWYLGTFVPVIGLVAIGPQGMADRYTYIPLIGIYFAFVWWFADAFVRSHRIKLAVTAGVVVLLSVMMLLAGRQIGYWRSSEALYEHTLDVTENNWFVHNLLGIEHEKSGKLNRAEDQFSAALGIIPDYPDALLNMGNVQERLGNPEAAIDQYRKALKIDPSFAKVHNNLGNLLVGQGRLQEGITHFQKALEIQPDYAVAHYNLGNAFDNKGRIVDALGHYLEAVRADPLLLMAYNNLAVAMYRLGNVTGAVKVLKEALAIDPDFQLGQNNLEAILNRRAIVETTTEKDN